MRNASWMAWRTAARKAGHRQIEAAPEKMHRARLADEAGAELFEQAVAVDEDLQEALHRLGIVGGMCRVLRESRWLRQLVRHVADDELDSEFGQRRHHGGVEACDRLPGQRELPLLAVTGGNAQHVVEKVEVDLKGSKTV